MYVKCDAMLECDIWIKHTTVENDYAIVIAMLSDWLKTLPGFQPMRSKAKTNRTLYALWATPVTGNY